MRIIDDVLATLTSFTRLPWWRLKPNIPAEAYTRIVPLWPLAGWVTGGFMAFTYWLTAHIWPLPVALLCAILVRLLLTGAMHEDGLADFADGMGGGRDKQHTLSIMKDSHIGTFGVVTLILYFLLSLITWTSLGKTNLSLSVLFFCVDPLAKYIASFTILLPYARTAETAKNHLVYKTLEGKDFFRGIPFGILPTLLLLPSPLWAAILAPLLVLLFLLKWMQLRIGGYTGDCCGATCLLCELSYMLALLALATT